MTPLTVGFIGLGILFILLFSGMPIGFVMALVGFAGFAYLQGFGPGLGLVKITSYTTFASYDLSIIPLFILMGTLCFFAGISKDLYDTVHSWLGQLRGGLAMATVGACAGFAAVSGSSLATAATMGTVALPEMKRYNYDPALATGSIAAGGTIGILIPPSVILVLYGILTAQSIGKLFLAGFIPGILEALFYMAVIYILCKRRPLLGPPGPRTSLIDKIVSLKNTWVVLVLFVVVIGGIYLGVFTPTEAAGVGACGAFIFAVARRRLGWQAFKSSLIETGKTTAMIFIIILGAMILGYFLAVSRLPFELANYIGGLPVNRYVVLGAILLMYVALGCLMDSMAIMLLITPIFFPLAMSLGFDPIWFGILVTRVTEIGMITPPVGINVYVIQGVAKDVPIQTIFRGIVPFLIADICHVALLVSVPQLSLFLPGLMK
ncbi:C4-dicarboxylate TRAP transporter large permease protein DctM [subsurface metagenome]